MLKELLEMEDEQALQDIKDAASTAYLMIQKLDTMPEELGDVEAMEYLEKTLIPFETAIEKYSHSNPKLADYMLELVDRAYVVGNYHEAMDIMGEIGSLLNREK